MVACDDTRHVVFPQPALHSDLAHLGQGLNLPDYPLCALLFISDTVPGDAFLMTPVLPLDVAGQRASCRPCPRRQKAPGYCRPPRIDPALRAASRY